MSSRGRIGREPFDVKRRVLFLSRRDRLAVYLSILEAIRKDASKTREPFVKFTHVMYKSNLSSTRLKERLLELSYLGLVVWNEHGIKLTEKGVNFLREVKKMFKVIEEYGLSL